jgi:hypothetical protein
MGQGATGRKSKPEILSFPIAGYPWKMTLLQLHAYCVISPSLIQQKRLAKLESRQKTLEKQE